MIKKIIAAALLIFSQTNMLSLSLTVSLANQAQLDIFITTEAEPKESIFSLLSSTNTITSLSLMRLPNGITLLWRHDYTIPLNAQYQTNILNPQHHTTMPQIVTNPYVVTLPSSTLENIDENRQLYLYIRQRTYSYNPTTNSINFFKHRIIFSDPIDFNTHLMIHASGIIAQELFGAVPVALQNQFPRVCSSLAT